MDLLEGCGRRLGGGVLLQRHVALEEHGRPHLAGVVDLGVGGAHRVDRRRRKSGAVGDVLEGEAVLGHVDGVRLAPEACVRTAELCAGGVDRLGIGAVEIVAFAQHHEEGVEVAPPLGEGAALVRGAV